MGGQGTYADFPSPPSSMYYAYGESEHYLSESQSPNNSTYDVMSSADCNFSSRYPSPGHEEGEFADSADAQKPAAKRKRENRYKNAPPAVLSRRRAQNRASQRAYRERKDQRIKDLEQMLNDAKQRNDVLGQAYAALHAEYVALKSSQVSEASYPQQYDVSYGGGSTASSNMALNPAVDEYGLESFAYADLSTGYAGTNGY